jgi:hypothetical protein
VKTLQPFWSKFRSFWRRRKVKREIDEELRFHLEQGTAENIAAGMSPEDAARAARKRFGNFQNIREDCRDARGASFGETLLQDIRFGLRRLRMNPGFTVVAVLTLALGIGACTAIFSVVHAVLLKPLPFHEPARLVWIENIGAGSLSETTSRVDVFREWREQSRSLEELACYHAFHDQIRYTLSAGGEPQRLRGAQVSQNFLDVLGVKLALGRGFADEECVWNGRRAVILSHSLWRQTFGAEPAIVGQSVNVNGSPTLVVGVLPQSFDFGSVFTPGNEVELLAPFPLVDSTPRQ